MKLLAIDTATDRSSVALWCTNVVAAQPVVVVRQQQDDQPSGAALPELLAAVLAAGNCDLHALDGLAVTLGPGSFTGLRIGLGFVQGLAYGLNVPVLGLSTLQVLARTAPGDRVVAALDARKNEVYWGAYARADGAWTAVIADAVEAPAALDTLTAADWSAVGNGFSRYPELAARWPTAMTASTPLAEALVRLAARQWPTGTTSALQLQPVYLRNRVVD